MSEPTHLIPLCLSVLILARDWHLHLHPIPDGPTSAFQHLGEPSGIPTSPGSADDARLSKSPVASLPRAAGSFLDRRASATPSGPLEWSRYLPERVAQDWDEPLHEDLLRRFFTYFNG